MQREKLIQLVTDAQQGNQKALNELFNAFYENIHYHILKQVKDKDLAQQVTQDAFIEVFRSLHTLREPMAFVSWMMKIVHRHCNAHNSETPEQEILSTEDENGHTIFDTTEEDRTEFIPDEAVDQKELKQTILSIVDQLPAAQRAAVLMYYFDELSIKEIAEIQEVAEGTVKSRLNYARKAIQASIEAYEQKYGVQLHAVSDMALLRWLRKDGLEQMSPQDVQELMLGVSDATEIPLIPAQPLAEPLVAAESTPSLSHTAPTVKSTSATWRTVLLLALVLLLGIAVGYFVTTFLLNSGSAPQVSAMSSLCFTILGNLIG